MRSNEHLGLPNQIANKNLAWYAWCHLIIRKEDELPITKIIQDKGILDELQVRRQK